MGGINQQSGRGCKGGISALNIGQSSEGVRSKARLHAVYLHRVEYLDKYERRAGRAGWRRASRQLSVAGVSQPGC